MHLLHSVVLMMVMTATATWGQWSVGGVTIGTTTIGTAQDTVIIATNGVNRIIVDGSGNVDFDIDGFASAVSMTGGSAAWTSMFLNAPSGLRASLYFNEAGTSRYWFYYDGSANTFNLRTTDGDGIGTDAILLSWSDGKDDLTLPAGFSTDGLAAPTSGILAAGPIATVGTTGGVTARRSTTNRTATLRPLSAYRNTGSAPLATSSIGILFQGENYNNILREWGAIDAVMEIGSAGLFAAGLSLKVMPSDGAALTEAVRIDASGNVGIGVTPVFTLTASHGSDNVIATFNSGDLSAYIELSDNVGSALLGTTTDGRMTVWTGGAAGIDGGGVTLGAIFEADGDLVLPNDNDYARFGVGADLNLGSDGTNGIVGADALSLMNSAGTETYATGANNGAFVVYYDNTPKLGTVASGVEVAGDLSVDDRIILRSSTINAQNQNSYLTGRHYTLAEEPVGLIFSQNISGENRVRFGGFGSGTVNSPTSYEFGIAANTTTLGDAATLIFTILTGGTNVTGTAVSDSLNTGTGGAVVGGVLTVTGGLAVDTENAVGDTFATRAYARAATSSPTWKPFSAVTGSGVSTAAPAGFHVCTLGEVSGRQNLDPPNTGIIGDGLWYDGGGGSSTSRNCENWTNGSTGTGSTLFWDDTSAGAFSYKISTTCSTTRPVAVCSD